MATNRTVMTNAIDLIDNASIQLAPLGGSSAQGLTMQAWIRVRAAGQARNLLELAGGPNGERVAFKYGAGNNRLFVEVTVDGKTYTPASIDNVVVVNEWIQATATLAPNGACAIWVRGKKVGEERDAALSVDALGKVLSTAVFSRCTLSRSVKAADGSISGAFPGALAEVRVWNRKLTDTEINANWKSRARGDEAGLLACYPLDAIVENTTVLDIGPRRGHGRVSTGATAIRDDKLSLASTSGTPEARIDVRGKLVREWFPLSAFPQDRALVPAAEQGADRQRANAEAFGDITDDAVLCSVYEATVEPRRVDGMKAVGDTIRICVDGPLVAVIEDAEESTLVAWTPGNEYTLTVPASGRLRVRVLAGERLDCPAIRMGWSQLPAGIWQAARPAELAHRKLQAVTADDLLQPPEGTASPLPTGTSRADAEALAGMLAAVAMALPVAGDEASGVASFADTESGHDKDDDGALTFGLEKWIAQARRAVAHDVVRQNEAEVADEPADTDTLEDGEEASDVLAFGFLKSVKKAGNKVADTGKDVAKDAEKEANDAAKKAEEEAKKAEEEAKKAADAAAKKAAEEAERVAAAKKAAEEAARAAEAAKKAAEEAAKKAAEEAAKAAEAAKKAAADAARISARLAAQSTKQASQFIVRSGADLVELAERAAKVTPQFGKTAIVNCIRNAAQVAVATATEGQAWRVVQLVGTSIVNGVEQTWRVVVSGIEDALATIAAFFERIGASIRKVIDYLAKLFSWQRFLNASDTIYDLGLQGFDSFANTVQQQMNGLFDRIEQALHAPLNSPLADKTIGEAMGIDTDKGIPVFDELEYVLDQAQRLFGSKKRKVESDEEKKEDIEVAATPTDEVSALIPKDAFTSPKAIFDLPMRTVLALPLQAWNLSEPAIRPLFKTLGDTGVTAINATRSSLKARIYVPWLTPMLEKLILGGRKLNLMRIISLIGAIPMVLIEAGSELLNFGADNSNVSGKSVRWLTFAASLLNSLITTVRGIIEFNAKGFVAREPVPFFLLANGACGILQAAAGMTLASYLKGSAAAFVSLVAVIDLATGLWYFVYAKKLEYALSLVPWMGEAPVNAVDTTDMGIEIVMGLCVITLAVAAYAEKESDDETIGATLAFRATSAIIRAFERICEGLDNKMPKLKPVTVGLCISGVVIDAAEGIYYVSKMSRA